MLAWQEVQGDYGVHHVTYVGWVDLDFDVPLSARFCLGRLEFGRTGWAGGQDDGTSKFKSTQPR